MKTLEEISLKYNTDKGSNYHDYLNIYEKYFSKYRDTLENFLEIGIWKGDSIQMWREYFNVGNLVALDIIPLPNIILPNTKLLKCDQSNRNQLSNIINTTYSQFDIIIDDGGHWMHQQQISLGYLFKYLKPGGVYVIEDLHTSGHPHYTRRGDTNTLRMLYVYMIHKIIISNIMTQDEIDYLLSNIDQIVIEHGKVSPIAFITKKI